MLSTSSPSEAACPVCETPAPLATLCSQRACAKQGVHTIPIADARLAWAEPSSKREPLVGQFVGEFLITRRLGKGGFGKVLLGLQRPLFKLQSAVKLLELTGQDSRVAEYDRANIAGHGCGGAVVQNTLCVTSCAESARHQPVAV